MRLTLSSGTRVQYTHPPNGSLNGMSSTRTSVRLTPLGPMPRNDTPCVVGCDDRLLVRRNRLNVGTCRSTSSATTAGEFLMASVSRTLMLAGMLPSRSALREGVTVTVSSSVAGSSTISRASDDDIGCRFSANPPARMTSVAPALGAVSRVNRPSGPVTVCASVPELVRTITVAPDTTPPLWSRTTPVTVCWTSDKARHAAKNVVKLTFHVSTRNASVRHVEKQP